MPPWLVAVRCDGRKQQTTDTGGLLSRVGDLDTLGPDGTLSVDLDTPDLSRRFE